MTDRTIRILVLAAFLTVIAVGIAQPASFTYSSYRKEIRAGVLIFPNASNEYLAPPTVPYLFHVLNHRMDLKPQGWEFVNPLAPSRVTGDIVARWNGAAGPDYTLGQAVTKDMGCYWEVKLSAGVAELSEFDILFIGLNGTYDLGRLEREKLRKLVDAGGVLWVENSSAGSPSLTNFITPDIIFGPGGTGWAGAPNRLHPLVHRPYDLAWDELSRLGTDANELNGTGVHFVGNRLVGFGPGADKYFVTTVGYGGSTAAPIMAASQYGSGRIVVTSEQIGYAISRFASGGTTRFCTDDRFGLAPSEDLKAAVNIISWGGEHTTFQKNARHTGFSYDEVGAPLALKWRFTEPAAPGPTGSSPAILNDMVFYVDAGGVLHAFDLSPAQDIDGNGEPDDSVNTAPDFSVGAPYDEVWVQPCGTTASSPTVANVPIGGGAAVPAVFVATADGIVLGFNAMTGQSLPGGNPVMSFDTPYPLDADNQIVPAPTYFDGVLYAGDGAGRVQAKNLRNGQRWTWPASSGPAVLPSIMSSPTVGYFRNPISGSVDQLVYVAARGRRNQVNGCVYSFPMKIFNEVLTAAPGSGLYRVRKYQTMPINTDPSTYQLFVSHPDGTLTKVNSTAQPSNQIGTFHVNPADVPSGSSVIADYEMDTSGSPYPVNYRQRIDVKNRLVTAGNPPGLGVLSTPAAAANDALYFATESDGGTASSLYAVMEDGWGITTKWRWYLGDPGVMNILGGSASVVGSPAVGKDMVYYAVNGGSGAFILALDADPVFSISVGGPIDSRRPVEVLQFDSMNPGRQPTTVTGAAEGTDTTRRRVAFKVDYEKGRITVENFLDPLSSSQDLIVRFFPPTESGPGTQVEQVHLAFPPDGYEYDDYWNNLAWYLPINTRITSSPMLLGSMLYFGDQNGRLHAVNVQRVAQTTGKGRAAKDSNDVRWEWSDGSGAAILATVASAHGSIAISTARGLTVLHNALTLVADSRRVLEADSSGRVVWSCDATTSYTGTRERTGSGTYAPVYAAKKTAFNRPAVARRVGTSNVVVADTGNNRVVLIDRAGTALVEITDFLDPGAAVPPGTEPILPPGAPTRLNSPTDVQMRTGVNPITGTLAYWFLIADSGNYRVVEIEAVYDTTTGKYRPELRWATRTFEQGKRYRYISACRYPKPTNPAQSEIICVIDNYVPESSRPETTGGAIVTIDEFTGRIVSTSPTSGQIAPEGVRRFAERRDGNPGVYRLVNPTFFSRTRRSGGSFVDLIGDSTGIYAAEFAPGSPVASSVRVYRASDHTWAKPGPVIGGPPIGGPMPLSVVNAQLLPSGNVLVTNKASSLDRNAPAYVAQGEVFELSSDFTTIEWPTPGWGIGQGSYPLEQPSSAERLYQ